MHVRCRTILSFKEDGAVGCQAGLDWTPHRSMLKVTGSARALLVWLGTSGPARPVLVNTAAKPIATIDHALRAYP